MIQRAHTARGGCWEWWIDQTELYRYYWPNLGYKVEAGLESYDGSPYIYVPPHCYCAMVHAVNWGAWEAWVPDGGTAGWIVLYDNTSNNGSMQGYYADSQDGYAWEQAT